MKLPGRPEWELSPCVRLFIELLPREESEVDLEHCSSFTKGIESQRAVIISGVPPFLLKTADCPEGIDQSVFDRIQKATAASRHPASFF